MEKINLERAIARWKPIAERVGCIEEKHIKFVCESAEFISNNMSALNVNSDKLIGQNKIIHNDGRVIEFNTLPIIVKYLASNELYKLNYSFSNENNNPIKLYYVDIDSLFEDAQKIPDDEKYTFYNDLDQKVSKVLSEDIHRCLDKLFENSEEIVIKGLFITLEQINNEVIIFLYCDIK